ncbi:MAG: hypothetical protein OZSIB_1353 [Candidatus Ozemobacter sibiricus]|jgi:predicted nucleotidyltransferase|uniref:Polymerase nucleotidyl transferase domain-containing protein n=1 Tax=Candidatus Ozemobacter sibiricus TaxID=2268124 RepID=A0A367ZJX3_9BACT|nr:MAG: hypothetical protein OZSIB_1353 [Candidatus Ozemobacter sibiricus]
MLEQLMLKIRNVPQNPETVFDPFAQEMAKLLGEDLETIACYGSAASGDYVYGRSDINMVLLFKTVSVPHLKVISVPMEKWATRGFAAPLILTRKDLERALDALPLLFMELRDNHRVIHGPDPFQGLTIEKAHLRLQVEQMLRSKLTEARTEFIASGESLSTFENMLAKSFNSLIPLLRGMLVLTGATPSIRKDLVVASAEERFRLEPGLLTDCLRHKMGLLRISDKHNLLKFYEKYLGTIEHLADLADGLAT